MHDCLFCKIAAGEIPCNQIYSDERVLAFYDIAPAAPVHFLVIPKSHIGSCADVTGADGALVGHIFTVIATLAAQLGLDGGFRVVSNVGKQGGQSVPHLHFHVLGGRDLAWPPG